MEFVIRIFVERSGFVICKDFHEVQTKTRSDIANDNFRLDSFWSCGAFFGRDRRFPVALRRSVLFFQTPAPFWRFAGSFSHVYCSENRLSFLEKIRFFVFRYKFGLFDPCFYSWVRTQFSRGESLAEAWLIFFSALGDVETGSYSVSRRLA